MTARALCLARPQAAAARRRRGAGTGSRRRVVPASSSPSPASASDDASAFDLPPCVATVTRVDASGRRREFYVVGTVHTPGSASAEEVRAVIERVRPDAVVLELDQERLDALVDTALLASSTTPAGSGSSPGGGGGGDPARDDDDLPSLPYALASPTGYGADFLSGFAAAEAAGAVVVLGDAKARSLPDAIRANLFARPAALLDAPRLWRSFAYVLEALGAFDPEPAPPLSAPSAAATVTRVRFADALASDTGKLAPLRGPAFVAAAALLADLASYASGGGGEDYSVEAVAAGAMGSSMGGSVGTGSAGSAAFFSPSSAFGFFSVFAGLFGALAFGRSAEVLLQDRDDVLADAAARASAMAAGLRRGDLVRVAHGFDADADVTRRRAAAAAANAVARRGDAERSVGEGVRDDDASSPAWPCFTLRRPLAAGEVRRLNLFEPRWLAMMDRLAEANGGDLVGAELACSLGVNRRYVRRDWDYWADAGRGRAAAAATDPSDPRFAAAGRPRSADIVVEPSLRRARVVRFAEGRREVTGARKLEVWIEGAEEAEAEAEFSSGRRLRRGDDDARRSEKLHFRAHPAGYLEARVFAEDEDPEDPAGDSYSRWGPSAHFERPWGEEEEDDDVPVRCVCVVGLAHCNGLAARLARADLDAWR